MSALIRNFRSVFLLFTFVLISCGGGGDGSSSDITAPSITLTGDNPQIIEINTAYTELGATAQDDVNGDMSADIAIDTSDVDTSNLGSYNVTYNISDAAGNAATTQTRTVNVVDTTAPTTIIEFPTKTGLTSANTITVRGTANDPSGVANIEVNGVNTTTNDNYANWWANVPLIAGANDLLLNVVDNANNESNTATEFTIEKQTAIFNTSRWITLDAASDPLNPRALVIDATLRAVLAVEFSTGNHRILSNSTTGTGVNFNFPYGIVLDAVNDPLNPRALVIDVSLGAVVAVDLYTGDRSILSNSTTGTGTDLSSPVSITLDAISDPLNPRALVADNYLDVVFAVDLSTGNRSIISNSTTGTGTDFFFPVSIILDAVSDPLNPRALVTGFGLDAVIAIDLNTGDRSIISDSTTGTGVNFDIPESITLDVASDPLNPRALVTDIGLDALVAVDLSSGDRSIISNSTTGVGTNLITPTGITLDAASDPLNPRALVVDVFLDAVFAVDLGTGDRSIIANNTTGAGTNFDYPDYIALDAASDPLNPRVLVTDIGLNAMVAVDLSTGDRSIISNSTTGVGTDFSKPLGIALDAASDPLNPRALVVDINLRAVVAVDLSNGNRSIIANDTTGAGTNFDAPRDITLDAVSDPLNPRALVIDYLSTVFAVDLSTGDRNIISNSDTGTGAQFLDPQSITLDVASDPLNPRALVTDNNLDAVFAVDLSTGNRSIISNSTTGAGVNFITPVSIILDATSDPLNPRALVTDDGLDAVVAVDLSTGDRSIISDIDTGTGILLLQPRGITLDATNNRILVVDRNFRAVVVVDSKVNPNIIPVAASGDRVILSK